MSKKSKHHKPKGPKNPPQNMPPMDPPAEVEQRVPNPKPDPLPVVDVKPTPEPATVVAATAKPEAPACSESLPGAPEAAQTPVKPKRHRNRKKKNAAGNTAEVEINQESEVSEVKKVDEKPKATEQPIKPVVESGSKPAVEKKEPSGKDKGAEQGKKGDKNKKGDGGNKSEDDKCKAKQPDKQNSVSENKNKDNQQQVKDNAAQAPKNSKKKNEKANDVKKDVQPVTSITPVEEKKVPEVESTAKTEVPTTDDTDSTAFVEAKSGKKSKSKNKKGKETKEEVTPVKNDILSSPAPDTVSKDMPASVPLENKEVVIEKAVEKIPSGEIIKPEVPVNLSEQKNKKDKNANKKKQNEKESSPKQSTTPTPKSEIKKVEEKKDVIIPESSPKIEECKKELPKEAAPETLDDILPSLASSIEETLKKLIVCESDELFGQQLQAAEEERKQALEKLNEEKKKAALLISQQIAGKVAAAEKKVEAPKEITTVCEIVKPTEDINLLSKILHPEEVVKHVDPVPEPIPLPFAQIHPEGETLNTARAKTPEVPKNNQKNKKSDKNGKKNGKQEPVCPFMNVQQDACKLPSPSDKKELPKLSDITPSFSGEKDLKSCPVSDKTPSPTTTPQLPKVDQKQFDPPVMKSSIPDELIQALLSDVPPEFIAEQSETLSKNLACSLPITKSETVKDNIPECALKSKVSKPLEALANITTKVEETVSQIKDVVCEQIKKPLDVIDKAAAACLPKPSTPTPIVEEKKQDDIPPVTEKSKAPQVEASAPAVCEKVEENKQKNNNKKKDKKKGDQNEQKLKGSTDSLTQTKTAPEVVPALPTEQKIEETPKKSPEEKKESNVAVPSKTETKPSEPPLNVEPGKPTDSPKPAKRQNNKKNKQGGNKPADAQSVQTQSASIETTASPQAQQSTDKSAESQKDKQTSDGKAKTEQKSGQDKGSKGKSKAHSNTQTDAAETQRSQNADTKPKDGGEIVNITHQDFELLKAADSIAGDSSSKEDGKDPNRTDLKQKQRSPFKDQPKNLLGPSNIPAKSNKYDYKKEKNKDPEQVNAELAKTKMKDVSPEHLPVMEKKSGETPMMQKKEGSIFPQQKTIISSSPDNDKSIKRKEQCVDFNNNIIEMDEEEEFVYKYSFRTVFIANACHICKIQLKEDRVVCRFCHLVGYCSEKHRDDDWMQHQSLCYSICTLSHVKGIDHIYGDAKSLNGQDYRLLRMQAIVSCEKLLKRKLSPWEQEVLLYPRICCEVSCRECKTSELKDCEMCGQVSYCANKPEHLPANHALWCQSYKLYHRLVMHQLTSGRIEPELPSKILPAGYILPDKCSTLFDDLYGCVTNMDDCHYATLTQLSTAPLSALYTYQKAIAALQLIEQSSPEIITGGPIDAKKDKLVLHIVGAELQFEADSLNKWEVFFLHLVHDLKELRVVFIGPELNTSNLPVDLLTRIKVCPSCRQLNKSVKFEFHDGQLYHDYVESEKFSKPDLICAFNAGLHRATGYAGLDTWPETIASALRLRVPICATAYTEHEAPRDLARILRAGVSTNVIITPTPNPYASLRPDRNFISDDEMPLIFKNFHYSLVIGC